jgi:hypothetical protein
LILLVPLVSPLPLCLLAGRQGTIIIILITCKKRKVSSLFLDDIKTFHFTPMQLRPRYAPIDANRDCRALQS